MTDLVERLRSQYWRHHEDESHLTLRAEAAAEIERLRAALAQQQSGEPVAWRHTVGAVARALDQVAKNGPDYLMASSMRELSAKLNLLLVTNAAPQQRPLSDEDREILSQCMGLIQTVRYIQGIAERGEGRPMRDDETVEQFLLGYVKRLEAAPQQRKPLTDKEIVALPAWEGYLSGRMSLLAYTRAVEAKHDIKEAE